MHWLWLGFFAVVGALLLLHRKTLVPARARTIATPAFWFLLGLAFVGVVFPIYEYAWFGATLYEPSTRPGADASVMFVSAYLIEYALSFDAVVVIVLLCRVHRIPTRHQPRVVFWGLVGSIVVRVVLFTGVASLARLFTWSFYVFGAFLIVPVLLSLRDGEEEPWLPNLLSRVAKGGWLLTMVGVCGLDIVVSDAAFALDSIALLSVSKTTFILVTASILATVAQRSWFFVPGVENLRSPRHATGLLLVFIGAKMLASKHLHVRPSVWLAVITGVICFGIVESMLRVRRPG